MLLAEALLISNGALPDRQTLPAHDWGRQDSEWKNGSYLDIHDPDVFRSK